MNATAVYTARSIEYKYTYKTNHSITNISDKVFTHSSAVYLPSMMLSGIDDKFIFPQLTR